MDLDRKVRWISAAIYGGISIAASVAFFAAASASGQYTAVARIGGALWVLLLSFIVTMPPVISAVKRRMKG
ncbi:MAG TPA: hypothetical protein VF814_19230 [Casimicrobiaceae bacterium]